MRDEARLNLPSLSVETYRRAYESYERSLTGRCIDCGAEIVEVDYDLIVCRECLEAQ